MKSIMYHYVRPDSPDLPFFRHLHIDDFRSQLDYLVERFDMVDRKTYLEAIDSREFPENACVLTFDDGFKDHVRYVLPELESRGLWGIFYVPTGMLTTGEVLDVHRVHLLLGAHGGRVVAEQMSQVLDESMISDERRNEFQRTTYRAQQNDEWTLLVKQSLNYFISNGHRKRVLDSLMATFFGDEKKLVDDFYMTNDEIASLDEAGMIVGAHSVSHPVMSRLPVSDQKREIADSFSYLDSVTGGLDVRTFCYPYGSSNSFSRATEELLSQAGCAFSFSVDPRDIHRDDILSRPQALPRYDCNVFPHGACRPLNND